MSESNEEIDLTLDFLTSSAISKVGVKFLAFYVPIFWFGGLLAVSAWFGMLLYLPFIFILIFMPALLFALYYCFMFGCILSAKLLLVLINLIHKPKEGVFKAQERDNDYEFWRLRTELKKLGVWLLNNCPMPWSDAWAFRWFGLKMDFSSNLQDSWIDIEYVKFGKHVIVGQAAVVMSSMIIGNYLIIKKVYLDDYAVVGGMATVGPGTRMKTDTLIGAASTSIVNQILDEGWIYFGMPAKKLQPNKLAVKGSIKKKLIDEKEAL